MANYKSEKALRAHIEKTIAKGILPYAMELGLLLHEWNLLHAEITFLFVLVSLGDNRLNVRRESLLLASWNAVPNERLQRHMLREVAKVRFTLPSEQQALDGVLWLLKMADILGRNRDDSAHMPLELNWKDKQGPITFGPLDMYEHPIARQMLGKDILSEYQLTRTRINTLSDYALHLSGFFLRANWQKALPKIPVWPDRSQSLGHKASPEPFRPPRPKRRRKASQA